MNLINKAQNYTFSHPLQSGANFVTYTLNHTLKSKSVRISYYFSLGGGQYQQGIDLSIDGGSFYGSFAKVVSDSQVSIDLYNVTGGTTTITAVVEPILMESPLA